MLQLVADFEKEIWFRQYNGKLSFECAARSGGSFDQTVQGSIVLGSNWIPMLQWRGPFRRNGSTYREEQTDAVRWANGSPRKSELSRWGTVLALPASGRQFCLFRRLKPANTEALPSKLQFEQQPNKNISMLRFAPIFRLFWVKMV